MPGLRIAGRRWHISSDVLPVTAAILAVFYVVWFLIFLLGTFNLERYGVRYDCDQAALLRAFNYSLLGLFAISALLQFTVAGAGLRGGPLEPSRRSAIAPLMYGAALLWVLLFGCTIFGTFLISNPNIGDHCWKPNVCAQLKCNARTGENYISTEPCDPQPGETIPVLSPPCQQVYASFNAAIECFGDWIEYGSRYYEANYTAPQQCPDPDTFDQPEEGSNCLDSDMDLDADLVSEITQWYLQGMAELLNISSPGWLPSNTTGVTLWAPLAPWWPCLTGSCQQLMVAGEECNQWNVILNSTLPGTQSKKSFFMAITYASWAMVVFSVGMGYLAFNAFPDYSTAEDWEGTLKRMGRVCCFGGELSAPAPGASGGPASREIARSMHALFGGIDLDPSDRLLGMYLVSELQSRRRQAHVLQALEAAGAATSVGGSVHSGGVSSRLGSLATVSGSPKRRGLSPPTSLQPPPSPFATDSGGGTPGGSSHGGGSGGGSGSAFSPGWPPAGPGEARRVPLPVYHHTRLRLRSSKLLAVLEDAGPEEGDSQPQGGGAGAAAEGAAAAAAPQGQQGSGGSGCLWGSSAAGPASTGVRGGWAEGPVLKMSRRVMPILTPSGCAKELRITPQEAAAIYTGFHPPVSRAVVEEVRSMSKFAVVAYALQSAIWSRGQQPRPCVGNLNMLLKCLGRPLRINSMLRRRNVRALVQIAGVEPSDLLYVSYANAPGGVLPYTLMLHRQSKSVVLAIRGTVSAQDLVTDLLSSPLEVDGWMPAWVREANAGGEGMYAHAGICSSATAILKDLEDRGLLKELLLAQLMRRSPQATKEAAMEAAAPSCSAMEQQGGTAGEGLADRLAEWYERQQSGGALDTATSAWLQHLRSGSQAVDEEVAAVRRSRSSAAGPAESGRLPPTSSAPERTGPADGSFGAESDGEETLPLQRAQSIVRAKLQSEGWRVVVTGHSLGAAVACMVCFHLRESFPDLRCFAFNPPGGTLSWNLSKIAQSFCTSIVVGKDVISRLTFSTSKRLVDEMAVALARCKRPKLLVLSDLLLKRRRQPESTPLTFCPYQDMSDEALRMLEGYHRTSVLHSQHQGVEMYPPGRLMFLRPFKARQPQEAVWDAVWIEAQELVAEGILVSPSMMAHHRMFVLSDALRSALAGEAAEAQQGVAEEEATVLDSPA